jgi:hypothetical protein
MSPIFSLRVKQLDENISRTFTRINEYQTELEDEKDPNQRSQYRRRITQLRESLAGYQTEYRELQAQQTGESSTQMQEASVQLHKLNIQVNALGNLVLRSYNELQSVLLTRYSASEKSIVSELTKQLNQGQLATVEAILQAVESNQIPEREMQEFIIEFQRSLALVSHEHGTSLVQGREITEILEAPGLDFQHKLKVSLPIIPLLIDYEAEVGLGSGFNLKAMWEKWKENFRGK